MKNTLLIALAAVAFGQNLSAANQAFSPEYIYNK